MSRDQALYVQVLPNGYVGFPELVPQPLWTSLSINCWRFITRGVKGVKQFLLDTHRFTP
jgi:hypothetical protein